MDYYPIHLKLKDKLCLVVGGGNIAHRKIESLINVSAIIKVVAPKVIDDIINFADEKLITLEKREFIESDVEGCYLVYGATDNPYVNKMIFESANKRDIPVNIVDCPELCTFIVPSIVNRGKLTISISTSGTSPAFAKRIRQKLESYFGVEYEMVIMIMDKVRSIAQSSINDQKIRQKLFEDILDDDLLSFCKAKDLENVKNFLSQKFESYGISAQLPEISNFLDNLSEL